MTKLDKLIKEQMELLELPTKGIDKTTLDKRRRVVAANKEIISALSTGIDRAYIEKELERLLKELNRLEGGYEVWLKNTPYMQVGNNPQATYEKEMGVADVRRKVKFMKKILNYV